MNPIILLHGLFGFDQIKLGGLTLRYFGGIEKAIKERGHPLLVPRVHPSARVAQRAEQLKEQIERWLQELDQPPHRAIILAHSMGGLDARHMISRLGMAEKIAALVTITTPHRGSPNADFWMENKAMKNVGLPLLDAIGLNVNGVADLTTASCARFNEQTPDSPLVRYFSIAGACPAMRVPLLLQPGYWIIRRKEGENDALVSVKSATWGKLLETWPVHHMHAINRRWPEDLMNPVGDISPYYLGVLEKLDREGVN